MPKNEYICDCTVVHKEIVQKVQEELCSDESMKKIASFFKILGNNTRMKILLSLARHELCVCDIANILSMTKSAVSHQLAILREASFVTYRREGKTVYYSLADQHIQNILESGLEHTNE